MFFSLLKFSSFLYCSQIIVLQEYLWYFEFRCYQKIFERKIKNTSNKDFKNQFIHYSHMRRNGGKIIITRLIKGSVLGSKSLGTIICFRKHQDICFISSFRLILLLMTVLTILFTWLWLNDPNTSNTTLFTSLKAHPFFLLRFVTLIMTKII